MNPGWVRSHRDGALDGHLDGVRDRPWVQACCLLDEGSLRDVEPTV